ncbi:DUF3265 domain-containing protein [Vibrio cholerae]|nr:DUF3265 domain-containing protein [Vibrio cholerae]ELB5725697.1 DUF3265 domain-containing protein [Vibrio cholerae]ELF3522770.1 DUF3265 domain-containing protein [Vibrio cholerae]ELI3430332.1 DUF3265 domain-containing protein [Vibrio cholerae]
MDNLDNSSNKLFKSDSQRVAFLLCVGFGVLGGMRELRYSVAHTLTGRYVTEAE